MQINDTNAMIERTAAVFRERFGEEPLLVRSPGRINIIGEHTDYNEGFVLPAAIDKSICVGVTKRADQIISLYAVEFEAAHETALPDFTAPSHSWTDYILGMVDQFIKRGNNIGGFNMVLNGNIPIGAGLSSSAAVECAVGMALNQVFEIGLDRADLPRLAQKAEQEYAGVMCGIMDMFASVFGKKEKLIKLDCRSLEYAYVPMHLNGYSFVLFNSNVKHSLASSAYNERRQQCEQGVAWIREFLPGVHSLRDVTLEMLDDFVLPKDPLVYRRCRFVVLENLRLLAACADLERDDLASLGEKMFETHEGLSKEYEVSCKELDVLIDIVKDDPSVLGARMMGGGFGGCTINLIDNNAVTDIVAIVKEQYQRRTGLKCDHYLVNVGDGTEVIQRA